MLVIVLRSDTQTALGTTVRYVYNRALVGHQGGERLNLVLIHGQRVANTAFHRRYVVRVYRAITCKHVNSVAQAHRKSDSVGRVTGPNLLSQTGR